MNEYRPVIEIGKQSHRSIFSLHAVIGVSYSMWPPIICFVHTRAQYQH